MDYNERLSIIKSILDNSLKLTAQEDSSFTVSLPGFGLRTSERASSPEVAIQKAVIFWVNNDDLNIANINSNQIVKVINRKTNETLEYQINLKEIYNKNQSLRNINPDYNPVLLNEEISDETNDFEEITEEVLKPKKEDEDLENFIDSVELIPEKFNVPSVFISDPNLSFEPKTINSLIYKATHKAWITLPSVAREKGIPELFITESPTIYEKYFGLKTKYGYLHTMASALLFKLATEGNASRKDPKEIFKLEIPSDYKLKTSRSKYLWTLPPYIEAAVIRECFNIMQQANQNPELLRQFKYQEKSDNFNFTTSHSRGIRETDPMSPLSKEMRDRMNVLSRGLDKPIDNYILLNSLISEFTEKISRNMDALLKEQHRVNQSSRFLKQNNVPSGKRNQVEDVLKAIILRKIIGEVRNIESFKAQGFDLGTQFEESEYILPE